MRRLLLLTPGLLCAALASAGCATAAAPAFPRVLDGVEELPAPSGGHAVTDLALEEPAARPGAEAQAADSEDAGLAKKLSNPIASLISLPFQYNYDSGLGPNGHGKKSTLNIQPVIPITLNEDWNIISRTIVPVISQEDIGASTGSQTGLGDVLQSFFFSPVRPTEDGWIWGVGPAFLLATGNDELTTAGQQCIGPTAVVLRQSGPWTCGALANYLRSVKGRDDRADVSSTFIQPFVAYTTPDAWTYSLNSESTYDFEDTQWTVPLNAVISKVVRFGKQPVSIGGGVRYYLDSPDDGPDGWGYRFVITWLFPR